MERKAFSLLMIGMHHSYQCMHLQSNTNSYKYCLNMICLYDYILEQ